MAKKDTLCWTCEWAAGKDKKCPWSSKFQPVPGWNADPTKIQVAPTNGNDKRHIIDSFIVHECPLYELADAIKRGIVQQAGKLNYVKKREEREKVYAEIIRLRKEGLTYPAIAEKLGYADVKEIHRIKHKMKEKEKNE